MRSWVTLGVAAGVVAMLAAADKPARPPQIDPAALAAAYLAQGEGQGWRFGGQPAVSPGANGAFTVRLPDLSYRGPGGKGSIEFGATTVSVKPDGDAYAVTAIPSKLRIADAAGVGVDARLDHAAIEGRWTPRRETFEEVRATVRGLDATVRGGHKVSVGELKALLRSQPAEDAAATGFFAGDVSLARLKATSPSGASSQLDTANLRLDLADMQRTPRLGVDYRQERPVGAEGLAFELIPVELRLDSRITPFPWREALRRLPEIVGGFASAAAQPSSLADGIEPLRELLNPVRAQVQLQQLQARTPSLNATGKGEARFQGAGPAVGEFGFELRGLDDRINRLDRATQVRHPELFPVLALLSMLGETRRDGRAMVQRYTLVLNTDGSVLLNGRNLSSIKVPN